jgi:hypothetical protein
MRPDTNRRALRGGMPWALVGFVLLAASIALWLLAANGGLAALRPGAVAGLAGIAGSALFAVGLATFARGRVAARTSLWLWAALALWVGELALRVRAFAADPQAVPRAALGGVRLLLVAGAMVAFANGVLWLWRDRAPRNVRATWAATRVFFLLQLGALALAAAIPGPTWHGGAPADRIVLALVWLVFAAPWAVLYVALRRTMRALARQQTAADVLAG